MRYAHLLLILALMSTDLAAQTSSGNSQSQTLNEIGEFANKICSDPAYSGSNKSDGAGAKVSGEILSLLKKLIDAKIEIRADFNQQTYTGMLQKDLLEATKNATACRLKIATDLTNRLLPKKGRPDLRVNLDQKPKNINTLRVTESNTTINTKDKKLPSTAASDSSLPVKPKQVLVPNIIVSKTQNNSELNPSIAPNGDASQSPKTSNHSQNNSFVNTPPIVKNQGVLQNSLSPNYEKQNHQIRLAVETANSALKGTSFTNRSDALFALLQTLPDNLSANEIALLLDNEKNTYRADCLRLLLRRTKLNSLAASSIHLILSSESFSYRVGLIEKLYPYIQDPILAEDAVSILLTLENSYRVDALNLISPKIAKPLSAVSVSNLLHGISSSNKANGINAIFNQR